MTLTNSPVFAVCMLTAGLAAGMVWYALRLKKNSLPVRAALIAAAAGSVLALLLAKLGYLLHDLGANLTEGYFDEITELLPEKLSFVGGALGITAGVALGARLSGFRAKKALDLFAAPGCVFLCLARLAEAGMETIGVGNEVEADWLKFFPLAIGDGWGGASLSVFVLEAAWALVCLVPALRTKQVRDRTAVWLLGAQMGFETLLQYPYIRSFMTSFVSLEQVLCAVLLLGIVVPRCIRGRKWLPLAAVLLLAGASVFFQFYRDNKIEFLFEEGWEWALDHASTISLIAFGLVSIGLAADGFAAAASSRAVAPGVKAPVSAARAMAVRPEASPSPGRLALK